MILVKNVEINMTHGDYKKLYSLQKSLLEMLNDFHSFCNEKKIDYFLGYGALIGLQLFDGFLPWDDDLDCLMPRADYNILREFCGKSIGKDSKIMIRDSKCDSNYIKLVMKCDDGIEIFIDVTPLDSVPDNLLIRKVSLIPCYFYFLPYYLKLKTSGTKYEKLIKNVFPSFEVLNCRRELCQIDINDKYENSNTVAQLSDCVDLQNSVFNKEHIYPIKQTVFEGMIVNVPNNINGFLESRYGNWGLPNFENRKPPHMKL